jgi:hypothetical protein
MKIQLTQIWILLSSIEPNWCKIKSEIKHVDVGLLGSNAVWTCRKIQTFRRNILPLSIGLKMEAAWRWRQYVPPKPWYLPTSPHGVTTKKYIDIFTAVRTSEITKWDEPNGPLNVSVYLSHTHTFNRSERNASRSDLLETDSRKLAPGLAPTPINIEIHVSCSK